MRFLQAVLAVLLLLTLSACSRLSAAYYTSGNDHLAKGDYDRAIKDYNQVIRRDPSAGAFNGRGAAYFGKGDYDRAIQDLNEAIRLNPKAPRALLNRGLANLYAGHSSDAQQDFSQNLQLDQKDLYGVMWLYLSRAKGGTEGKAELKTNTTGLDLSKWPGPMIQLYLGQNTPEDVLHAAGRILGWIPLGAFSAWIVFTGQLKPANEGTLQAQSDVGPAAHAGA